MNATSYLVAASAVVSQARNSAQDAHFDDETASFVNYWFDGKTQGRLASLACAIRTQPKHLHDPLWCAFSRLIITKDVGASLARDVSHSRPHRVRDEASFDPIDRFAASAEAVVRRHETAGHRRPPARRLKLELGDARRLPIRKNSVDVVMTSPPYLQAIDYLRGHRLSLVWMDYSVAEIRDLRASTIGTERQLRDIDEYDFLVNDVAGTQLSDRSSGILRRYISDLDQVFAEINRVLKVGGQATFVVAEATLAGVPIRVSEIIRRLANRHEFDHVDSRIRPISSNRRYLPPPTPANGMLDKRMREEACTTFRK